MIEFVIWRLVIKWFSRKSWLECLHCSGRCRLFKRIMLNWLREKLLVRKIEYHCLLWTFLHWWKLEMLWFTRVVQRWWWDKTVGWIFEEFIIKTWFIRNEAWTIACLKVAVTFSLRWLYNWGDWCVKVWHDKGFETSL